jgi:hypothetical protein
METSSHEWKKTPSSYPTQEYIIGFKVSQRPGGTTPPDRSTEKYRFDVTDDFIDSIDENRD